MFSIILPALRDRPEDIPDLVRHFVRSAAERVGRSVGAIPSEAMQALIDHHWPGNVRELQNVIERAVILAVDGILRIPRLERKRNSIGNSLNEKERDYILEALDENRMGNRRFGEEPRGAWSSAYDTDLQDEEAWDSSLPSRTPKQRGPSFSPCFTSSAEIRRTSCA